MRTWGSFLTQRSGDRNLSPNQLILAVSGCRMPFERFLKVLELSGTPLPWTYAWFRGLWTLHRWSCRGSERWVLRSTGSDCRPSPSPNPGAVFSAGEASGVAGGKFHKVSHPTLPCPSPPHPGWMGPHSTPPVRSLGQAGTVLPPPPLAGLEVRMTPAAGRGRKAEISLGCTELEDSTEQKSPAWPRGGRLSHRPESVRKCRAAPHPRAPSLGSCQLPIPSSRTECPAQPHTSLVLTDLREPPAPSLPAGLGLSEFPSFRQTSPRFPNRQAGSSPQARRILLHQGYRVSLSACFFLGGGWFLFF